jgi:hypothetical protein
MSSFVILLKGERQRARCGRASPREIGWPFTVTRGLTLLSPSVLRPSPKRRAQAFYDALAEKEGARQLTGDPALRVIATELVKSVRTAFR